MKKIIALSLFLVNTIVLAQKPCDYTTNISDSIGTYKALKDNLMYEKKFAGNSQYIFFTLESTNGTPSLNINLIRKSKEFLSANCFDANSKIFLQLNNGKIVSLVFGGNENCGSLIRDENGFDNRLLTGKFLFLKGSIEDLKSAPINLLRIKYLSEVEDYVMKKELLSELNGISYQPETYFMNQLHCIE